MKKIGDFLGKFIKLAQDSDETKIAVQQAVILAGIKVIDIKNITIRGGIATLKLTPIQKSEVKLKQKRIIEELSKNPLTKKITVVR